MPLSRPVRATVAGAALGLLAPLTFTPPPAHALSGIIVNEHRSTVSLLISCYSNPRRAYFNLQPGQSSSRYCSSTNEVAVNVPSYKRVYIKDITGSTYSRMSNGWHDLNAIRHLWARPA